MSQVRPLHCPPLKNRRTILGSAVFLLCGGGKVHRFITVGGGYCPEIGSGRSIQVLESVHFEALNAVTTVHHGWWWVLPGDWLRP
jgi:hypothetical protein